MQLHFQPVRWFQPSKPSKLDPLRTKIEKQRQLKSIDIKA